MGGVAGRFPGRGDFFNPTLKTVYMGGGMECLPGLSAFDPGLS